MNNTMCTIKLNSILTNHTFPDAGVELFDLISSYASQCDKVVIDMTDVISIPSILLNVSLGRFIEEQGIDKLKSIVQFSNISSVQAKRLQDYINKMS